MKTLHAIAYAVVMVVAPITHAVVEVTEFERVHIESTTFEHSLGPHDSQLCQLCRLATVPAVNPGRVVLILRAAESIIHGPANTADVPVDDPTLARNSRAPPVD